MKLFGQIIGTLIETVKIPIAVTKDVVTLGGVITERDESYTDEQLERIKEAAMDDE